MRQGLKTIIAGYTPIRWCLSIKKQIEDSILYKRREPFLRDLEVLFDRDTSIISSNCFAGRVMKDFGIQYNSPTVGLYFWSSDYIEFLTHLRFYLTEAEIEFVPHSKYVLGDQRRSGWRHWYPVGLLNGKVEIHFLHYFTEEEAAEKWYRRSSRVNWDKLFIVGMEQNLCSIADIQAFNNLPFENKVFFSTRILPELESNCYIPEFKDAGEVGDPYRKADIYYRELVKRFR